MSIKVHAGKFEHFVLRPLFWFATFVLVLFALVQATGRFTMAIAHLFEEQINLVAATQNAHLEGVRGSWRGFNPVVYVERLTFGSGHIDQLEIELDALESAWHNAPVLRYARAADVTLKLVQDQAGWRLAGAGAELPDIPLRPLLEQSDDIALTFAAEFANREQQVGRLVAHLALSERDEQRHLQLDILGENDDTFVLQGWQMPQPDGPAQVLVAYGGQISIPRALAGQDDVRLTGDDGQWHGDSVDAHGQLKMTLGRFSVPEVPASFALSAQIDMQRRAYEFAGRVSQLVLDGRDAELDLTGGHFVIRLPEPPPETLGLGELDPEPALDAAAPVRYWQSQLSLTAISEFVGQQMREWEALSQWANQAQIRGELLNLHLFAGGPSRFGYAATAVDISMRGHRGAPTVRGAGGQLWGHAQGAAFQLNSPELYVGFPRLYHDGWQFAESQGLLKLWIEPGYIALHGTHIKTRLGDSAIGGAFGWARPSERYEQRVGLRISVDQTDMLQARGFVPYRIPENLADWLSYGPQAGAVTDATFVYHGQVHNQEGRLTRRLELQADFAEAQIRFDRAWPELQAASGSLHVAGRVTRAELRRARSLEVDVDAGTLLLAPGTTHADIQLTASGSGNALLDFVRGTPLQENMSFVTEAWRGGGQLALQADMTIPLVRDPTADRTGVPDLRVDLAFTTEDFDLVMPDYRLTATQLQGHGTFSLPHHLAGDFSGLIFDEPATIAIAHDPEWLHFDIDGAGQAADIYRVSGVDDLGLLDGSFDFLARVNIAMGRQNVTNMTVATDLSGMGIKLPAHLAKLPSEQTPAEFDLQFLEAYQSLSWRYKDTQGWIHFSGDEVSRGAIGIGAKAPVTGQDQRAILISGLMDQLILSDWVSDDGEAAVGLPQDWQIQRLSIGEFIVGDLSFSDLILTGAQVGDEVSFAMSSADLVGRIEIPAEGLLGIELDKIRLPIDEQEAPLDGSGEALYDVALSLPAEDPIDIEVGRTLPAAQVVISELILGDEPFGRWAFSIEPEADRVNFADFSASVNGVNIDNGELWWNLSDNRSAFQGAVVLDDLATTLPLWDYAPVVSTDSAGLQAQVSWSGSPANIDLLNLDGDLDFSAENGRFLDIESGGGLRMLSLLNFSNVVKRISLDFSDVTGSGVEFDRIKAPVRLQSGQLSFREPMTVRSSASNFQVGGLVDLASGTLDNEMIVTLPVSDSLPWYGVYLALANPLAGLGVVIGERVLRRPIQAFSSAKYRVTGTLDEPQLKFVGIWDQSMRNVEEERAEGEPENNEFPDEQRVEENLGDAGDTSPGQLPQQNAGDAT